ncbi:MAG: hypothetical protein KME43_15895 [Myxacorys chilensis ATA2-1-KO14]|jgi:hypothetical protein|nr:hypothetical protein [Myxacorys chilensis ATA2-1-KO14]
MQLFVVIASMILLLHNPAEANLLVQSSGASSIMIYLDLLKLTTGVLVTLLNPLLLVTARL